MKYNVKRLTVTAMFIAISVALNELLKFDIAFLQGGSITFFSMVPLVLVGYVYGVKTGLVAGAVMGILNMFIGGMGNFAWVSGPIAYIVLILFDYVVAFSVMGTGGIFKSIMKNKTVAIASGAVFACFLRFICHFISGVTIWRDMTSDLLTSVAYSITYNGSYMFLETIITVVGCVVVVNIKPLRKLLENKQ